MRRPGGIYQDFWKKRAIPPGLSRWPWWAAAVAGFDHPAQRQPEFVAQLGARTSRGRCHVEPEGQGIAAGLPLSATVASKELMAQWPLGTHGTTFGGNPIACSAALASLEIIKDEKLLENSRNMGAYAIKQLEKLKDKHSVIKNIRGVGLMIGIELHDPATGKADGDAVMHVLDGCLQRGVLFYLCGNSGEVIRMIPPLTISKEQIDHGIDVLDQALTAYKPKGEHT